MEVSFILTKSVDLESNPGRVLYTVTIKIAKKNTKIKKHRIVPTLIQKSEENKM